MKKKELQDLQKEMTDNYRKFLTEAFGSRPKGRGNLSKKQIDEMTAGFADGCASMRDSLEKSGNLKVEDPEGA